MPIIESSRLLPDGSLEVILLERTTVVLPAKDVKPAAGKGKLKKRDELLALIRKAVRK